MSQKYEALANEILEKIGGPENVVTATHCMTRLRFNLKDRSKTDAEVVKNIEGVVDVIEKGGQFQVVIGTHVSDVFKSLPSFESDSSDEKEQSKGKWYNKVLDVIAGSFAPVIGAITGAGFMKVVILLLTMTGVLDKESQTYYILNYVSDTAFYFLPVLLAYGASQKFKTMTGLSLVLAAMLLHPSYTALNTGDPVTFMGIPVKMATYSASVVPILLIVWIQSYVEKFATKISPNCMRIFLAPMITLTIMTPLALCGLGPIGAIVGDYMASGFAWLNATVPWLAPCLMGGLTPLLVLTGMHYSLGPIGMAEYVTFGYGTFLTTGMVVSNIAQGVASFAVSLRTKDKGLKQLAGSSAVTGIMGISEPALYGVNLPLKYPLIASLIGGGCAGLYAGLTGVKTYAGGSQGLPALPAFFGGEAAVANFTNACIAIVISIVVTFLITYIWSGSLQKKEENQEK